MLYAGHWIHNRSVNASTLIVSQALIRNQDGVTLHPDLFLWHKQLTSCRQLWFESVDRNPLAWYAALTGLSSSALLASSCHEIPLSASQCWLASPYHAQLTRDTVKVYPEGLLPWSEADALYLREVLNPLLDEEGMQLHVVGAALLLSCREPMEAFPKPFGTLSGKTLPNQHHEGADGGRLNRLLSEIQMLLFQHPSESRHDRGELDVNGIWLSAPLDWPVKRDINPISVATRNPVLQSLVDGRDAQVMISEAERLSELLKADAPLPKTMILSGEGHAVLLTRSLLPKFRKVSWNPKSPKTEGELIDVLQGYVA